MVKGANKVRTIDADALVAQWEVGDEQVEDVIAKMFIQEAIRDVKHAPTIEPEPHWISCNERLPREEEQDDELGVLVTLGNGYSGLQCDWYHGDHWYDWDGFVVAWMPLPPVYQEEDNK